MKRTIAGGGTAELEVGKVYLNRLGLACRIVRSLELGIDKTFWDEKEVAYGPDGRWCLSFDQPDDLIQELEPSCDTPPK